MADTAPPVDRMTDTCKYITFPQTSLVGNDVMKSIGTMMIHSLYFTVCSILIPNEEMAVFV